MAEKVKSTITELEEGRTYKTFNHHIVKIEKIAADGTVKMFDISENVRCWLNKEKVLEKLVKIIR